MAAKASKAILWLRKGLRLHDNGALDACVKACADGGSVFPVYVLDKWHQREANIGNVRFEFILQSLRALDEALRKRGVACGVIFVMGEPETVLPKTWAALDADLLAFDDSEEPEPHCVKTDKEVVALAKKDDVRVSTVASHWLHDPNTYAKALDGGEVPTSMGQFRKVFDRLDAVPEPLPAPETIPYDKDAGETAISALAKELGEDSKEGLRVPDEGNDEWYTALGRARCEIKFPGGEEAGLQRLEHLVEKRSAWVANFSKPKTSPNSLRPDTTVLSPYIGSGCLSMRRVYHAVEGVYKAKKGKHTQPPESLVGQLMFRELWYIVGALSGEDVSKMKGNSLCRNIPWDRDAAAKERLDKWARGETGYPFIDAIMTQLRKEGWIHHLARHAVACFATRGDLWLHWEDAAGVFDRYLIDADWAVNNCNWQWLSCSAFFYQYFRCYSPVSFGKKTDPEGDYIRKYVPKLRKFPNKYIYEPWKAPKDVQEKAGCVIGKDYPDRIVDDHRAQSKANMDKMHEAYEAHKKKTSGEPPRKRAKRSWP